MVSRAPKRKIRGIQKANQIKKKTMLRKAHPRNLNPLQKLRKLEGVLKKYRDKFQDRKELIRWLDHIEVALTDFKRASKVDPSYLTEAETMLRDFEVAIKSLPK